MSTVVLFIISKAVAKRMCSTIKRNEGLWVSLGGRTLAGIHEVLTGFNPQHLKNIPVYLKMWLNLDKY